MYIRFLLHFHDSAHLSVLGLIHHHKGLGHISFFERVDLFGYLRRQVLILELTTAGIGVDHQTGTHHRVLIFRETNNRLFKLQTIGHDQLADGIQTLDGIHLVRSADARPQKDMTTVDTFAFFLDQLDNMVAVLGLHNAAHAFRVIEVKRHFRELRHQLSFAHKSQFTAALGALRIFGIQTRQHTKISCSVLHTLRELTQTLLDTLCLLHRHRRLETENLHFHLCRTHRDGVHRQRVVVSTYIRRRRFDVRRQFLLHLLDNHLVTYTHHHLLADLRGRLAEILLHLLLGSDLVDVIIDTHVHLVAHAGLICHHRVNHRLV